MPEFRDFGALVLALAIGGAACSASGDASSDGGTNMTPSACPSKDMVTLSSSCVPCLMAHCNAEQSAYSGPGWSSASASYGTAGGACGDWFMCIAKCACNDTACLAKCSRSSACMSAQMAASNCSTQNCATECAVSFNGSVTSGLCTAQNGSGGTCPTASLLGCCKTSTRETCVYPPFTAADGMQICASMTGGAWSTTP